MKTLRSILPILPAVVVLAVMVAAIATARGPGAPGRTAFEGPLENCYEQAVADFSSVVHPSVPTGAYLCQIQVEAQNVRYLGDAHPGSLTTRTDADTGVVTAPNSRGLAHGITAAHTVSVWWAGGRRTAMTVSSVTGTAITVDAGSGDNFPALGTPVDIGIDPTSTLGTVIYAGDQIMYPGDPARLRLIETAGSATGSVIMWAAE